MVEVVTNDQWRKPIGEYLKKKCHISAEIGDAFSYIGFIEDEKILGGFLFTDFDGQEIKKQTQNGQAIDKNLILKLAPKIVEGVDKLKKWSTST